MDKVALSKMSADTTTGVTKTSTSRLLADLKGQGVVPGMCPPRGPNYFISL